MAVNFKDMDIEEITKEVALKGLSIVTSEEQFLATTEMPEHLARLIFAAYQKGVGEYQKSFWNEQEERKNAEKKVVKLALFVADMVTEKKNNTLPF